MNRVFVCPPMYDGIKMPVLECDTCKRQRRFLETHEEYYGYRHTCLTCGEKYADFERLPRPFEPGWRKRNVESAKRLWARRKELMGANDELHDG